MKKCDNPQCNENHYALGLCNKCYQVARYWEEKTLKDKLQYKTKRRRIDEAIDMTMVNVKTFKKAN